MTTKELFDALLNASSVADVEAALQDFEGGVGAGVTWVPLGRENNQGTVGASSDPGRSIVERLTNGVDAVLEDEFERHNGIPTCCSPKDAATAWLNVPEGGLSELTPSQRRGLSQRVSIRILTGDGRESRTIEVRDRGVGLTPHQMPKTILSLNESNKLRKHHLVGVYGQGGSSTFAVSKYTLIASRRREGATVGFSVVRFQDMPPEEAKIGHYVYLSLAGSIVQADLAEAEFPAGTLVKHFGYDLSDYSASIGPTSVYGLLNQTLFDPVLPVWLDDHEVHGFRRVIKGSRNALNGAVDEGDPERRGPTLSHHVSLFYVALGDFGRIGIEYWVLDRPTKTNKNPTRAFVNPNKPVVLSLHGQSHGELSQVLVKKSAELPYLAQRLICHVDCNSLTSAAKRFLFVTNREDARRGIVLNLIQQEIVKALKSDDELTRLNNEAKEQGIRERDETAVHEMRKEIARLLRIQGIDVSENVGGEPAQNETSPDRPTRPGRRQLRPQPIPLHEPPTFIRIVWPEGAEVTFYSEQRRYMRIETDANSNYHNPNDPTASRVNIIRPDRGVVFCGSTSLQGGRMRAIFEGANDATIGETGRFRVELTRPGLAVLSDERPFRVVPKPPVRSATRQVTLPLFKWRPIDGPDEELWNTLGWPENINAVASTATMENGCLVISYSTVFPKFARQRMFLERKDPALATSFTKRYEIWLAVHSLLLHQDQQASDPTGLGGLHRSHAEEDPELVEARDRQERCRIATIASLFAAREIEVPAMATIDIE